MARPLKTRGEKILSRLVYDIAKKALPEEGKLLAQILQSWPLIVGEDLEKTTWPQKVNLNPKTGKAKLEIGVRSSSDRFLIHYQEETLRTKLQDYFGGTLLEKITFHHGIPPKEKTRKVSATPTPSELLWTTSDERLQKALERLQRALE